MLLRSYEGKDNLIYFGGLKGGWFSVASTVALITGVDDCKYRGLTPGCVEPTEKEDGSK